MAMLPINIFGLSIPFPFCGPPLTVPFGVSYLYLEPLWWQLPAFQFAFTDGELANELSKEGIDTKGPSRFKCPDEAEEEAEFDE